MKLTEKYHQTMSMLVVNLTTETKNNYLHTFKKTFSKIEMTNSIVRGFNLYQVNHPEVVLIEAGDNGREAIQFTEKVRTENRNTQILLVAKHINHQLYCKLVELRVEHLLLDPFTQDQVEEAIKKAVDNVILSYKARKQRLFLETLLNFQEDLIFTLDSLHGIVDCNEAFLQFFSEKRENLPKLNLNEYLVCEDTSRSSFYEVVDLLTNHCETKHYKLKLRNAEHKECTFFVKAAKIEPEQNTFVVCTDISELQKEIKKNEFLAEKDALTKVYNRYKFEEILNQEMQRAKRYNTELSLILIDIDHFKDINDTYGHNVGDEILAKVAKLIEGRIRETDILARWGGEEFVILIPETDQSGAIQLAETLRQLIESHQFPIVSNMTSSFGVCQYNGTITEKDFIYKADTALYKAKNLGRNRVVACDESLCSIHHQNEKGE